jgi:Holliday junction resolvasome RuvABC endonuclease subunit
MPILAPLTLKLLAIDPGLNNIGFSLFTFSAINRSIINISASTLSTEQQLPLYSNLSYYFDERTIKLIILKEHIINILHTYHTDIIVCEAPFFYGNKPNAFRALVESISTIKQTIHDIKPLIPFIQLEPLLVKKHVKSLNIHNKTSTKDALLALNINTFIDLNVLDEHSIDAISIGYAFLKTRELIV